jgi:predicted nuclease of predicted toxin-antitoxin system
MSLKLLLDENMSQVIAAQVRQHRPTLVIESVHTWLAGAFRGRTDKALLQAARTESLTLVTYDQKTIPPLLVDLYAEGKATPESSSWTIRLFPATTSGP